LDLFVSDLVRVIDVAKIKYQEFHADDAGWADFHGSDPREFAKSAKSAWNSSVCFSEVLFATYADFIRLSCYAIFNLHFAILLPIDIWRRLA
jgi:hypothetical protein